MLGFMRWQGYISYQLFPKRDQTIELAGLYLGQRLFERDPASLICSNGATL